MMVYTWFLNDNNEVDCTREDKYRVPKNLNKIQTNGTMLTTVNNSTLFRKELSEKLKKEKYALSKKMNKLDKIIKVL